jgi:imidazoleglycerol-phosphate dehydratase
MNNHKDLESRVATLERNSRETNISGAINLDGNGEYDVDTGNGFLDHMISQIARHSLIDITLQAKGDIHVGWHHLVEDIGILLGILFLQASGERRGIRRMGHAIVPLDETLVMVSLDCSGRGYPVVETTLDEVMVDTLSGDLIKHFLESFANEAKINLHIKVLAGTSPHHKAEAIFKALARALRDAVEPDLRALEAIPSTKGILG